MPETLPRERASRRWIRAFDFHHGLARFQERLICLYHHKIEPVPIPLPGLTSSAGATIICEYLFTTVDIYAPVGNS